MDDREIIELYLKRDERAIKETANKYGRYCSRIAGNVLLSEEDVEECLSDTWLRTWSLIPPYNPSNLKAFVGRIARGFAINRYKASCTRKRSVCQYTLALEELEDIIETTETVESEVESRVIAAAISDFLQEQPKLHACVFVRRYFSLDSIASISKSFGYSESKTKSILFRMRKKLRKYLEKEELI